MCELVNDEISECPLVGDKEKNYILTLMNYILALIRNGYKIWPKEKIEIEKKKKIEKEKDIHFKYELQNYIDNRNSFYYKLDLTSWFWHNNNKSGYAVMEFKIPVATIKSKNK